jgi:predicted transcriptional regulator
LTTQELWEVRRLEWIRHFVRFAKSPSQHSKNDNEKRSGVWQCNMRANFKNNKLSEERIELLNNTEGWRWEHNNFKENLDNWKEQCEILGRPPSEYLKDNDGKRAGKWQSHMRTDYKKNKLSEGRIELLNNTEGWKWVYSEKRKETLVKTFQENLDDWINHFVRLGKRPLSSSKDDDENRNGNWQSTMRANYKNNKLSQDKIVLLNNTEEWKWEEEDHFKENLDNWEKQFELLGITPNKRSKDDNDRKSGNWQCNMRANFKNNKLSEDKIVLLNNTKGWKWEEEDPFQENVDDWIRQFVRFGKTPSSISKDDDEKRSGKWQSNMRTEYKKKQLAEERIKLLTNTEGWKWVHSENRKEIIIKTFQENLDDWISQFMRLGKSPSQHSKDNDVKRSGKWQSTMRANYKNNKLSQEIIELLNNTEGWKWEREDPFQENLDDWKEHFVKMGRTPSYHSKNTDEKKVASWQSHTRQNYKKGTLSEIIIELLNNTEGWKW